MCFNFNISSLAITVGIGTTGYFLYCKYYGKDVKTEYKQIATDYKNYIGHSHFDKRLCNQIQETAFIAGACASAIYIIRQTDIICDYNGYYYIRFSDPYINYDFEGVGMLLYPISVIYHMAFSGLSGMTLATCSYAIYPYLVISSPILVPYAIHKYITPCVLSLVPSSSMNLSLPSMNLSLPSTDNMNKFSGVLLGVSYLGNSADNDNNVKFQDVLISYGIFHTTCYNPVLGSLLWVLAMNQLNNRPVIVS